MPKKGKSCNIGRKFKRRNMPDAQIPANEQNPTSSQHLDVDMPDVQDMDIQLPAQSTSIEQNPTSSQHLDDVIENPAHSFNHEEIIQFLRQLSSPSQHDNGPSTSDVNMVNLDGGDNIEHMDRTAATAVRMYENGSLALGVNLTSNNNIQA